VIVPSCLANPPPVVFPRLYGGEVKIRSAGRKGWKDLTAVSVINRDPGMFVIRFHQTKRGGVWWNRPIPVISNPDAFRDYMPSLTVYHDFGGNTSAAPPGGQTGSAGFHLGVSMSIARHSASTRRRSVSQATSSGVSSMVITALSAQGDPQRYAHRRGERDLVRVQNQSHSTAIAVSDM
jgi:hypothetical protein